MKEKGKKQKLADVWKEKETRGRGWKRGEEGGREKESGKRYKERKK